MRTEPVIPNPVKLGTPAAPNPCQGVTIRYQMLLVAPLLRQTIADKLYKALEATCKDLYAIGVRCLYTQGIYCKRRIRGGKAWSKHATAEAVDICGVYVLGDSGRGRKLTIGKHGNWAFMSGSVEGILRKHFRRVIGPREDPKWHRDHWHCEV